MIVRAATLDDAARCAEIYAPFVIGNWVSFETEPPDAAEMARRIEDYSASHGWLVAESDNGVLIGYAYACAHRTREAYRTSIDVAVYVDPVAQGRGIGRQLYDRLLPMMAGLGYHAAFAGIALPNDASIALHEALGFDPIGVYREVGWKMGGWRDVGWWQRLL